MSLHIRPTPAMAVALAALVISASGTSYAVSKLPAKSVGTKQLKSRAVTSAKLGHDAVTRTKIDDAAVTGKSIAPNSLSGGHVLGNSLTGNQLEESSLGTVPKAATADSAGIASLAFADSTMKSVAPDTAREAHAECPAGLSPVAGGAKVEDPMSEFVVDSYPQANGWTARVANVGSSDAGFEVHAVCAKAGADQGPPAKTGGAAASRTYPLNGR